MSNSVDSNVITTTSILIIFIILVVISLVVNVIVFTAIIAKYRPIYKIAHHNDMIRHDELIRTRERARIAQRNAPPPKPTRESIERTLYHIEHPNEVLDIDKGGKK